jgi:maltose O-acetyltransferase
MLDIRLLTVNPNPSVQRVLHAIREELGGLDPRWALAQLLTRPLPPGTGNRYRVRVLRALGYRIGSGTTLMGNLVVLGVERVRADLSIGSDCFINIGCVLDLTAPITIGDRVSVGHDVLILTSTHDEANARRRAGPLISAPVLVGDGAWIAARAVLLPGVVVGNGAIVCAGAVVTRSVEPHTMVGGVPARMIRQLDVTS